MSYPFSLQIPDWLPASTVFCRNGMVRIEYSLKAHLTPLDDKYLHHGKSMLRTSTKLYVSRPSPPLGPPKSHNVQIDGIAGGFCCCGGKPYTTRATLDRQEFHPGDRVTVSIAQDSALCEKRIDISIELRGAFTAHAHTTDMSDAETTATINTGAATNCGTYTLASTQEVQVQPK